MLCIIVTMCLMAAFVIKIILGLIKGASNQVNRHSDNMQADVRTNAILGALRKNNPTGDGNSLEEEEFEKLRQTNKIGYIVWVIITIALIIFLIWLIKN